MSAAYSDVLEPKGIAIFGFQTCNSWVTKDWRRYLHLSSSSSAPASAVSHVANCFQLFYTPFITFFTSYLTFSAPHTLTQPVLDLLGLQKQRKKARGPHHGPVMATIHPMGCFALSRAGHLMFFGRKNQKIFPKNRHLPWRDMA